MTQKQQPVYIAKVVTAAPLVVGELKLNPQRFEATLHGQPLVLSKSEYATLLFIAQNSERVVTQSEIRTFLAPSAFSVRDLVCKVRKELQRVHPQSDILNIHGVGYRLKS